MARKRKQHLAAFKAQVALSFPVLFPAMLAPLIQETGAGIHQLTPARHRKARRESYSLPRIKPTTRQPRTCSPADRQCARTLGRRNRPSQRHPPGCGDPQTASHPKSTGPTGPRCRCSIGAKWCSQERHGITKDQRCLVRSQKGPQYLRVIPAPTGTTRRALHPAARPARGVYAGVKDLFTPVAAG
jgi:hypothetical protein